MRLMGAHCTTFNKLREPENHYPLAVVWSRGTILRRAKMKREVRYGRYFCDFANDLNWMIEVDGSQHDVVADFERELDMREMLRKRGQDMHLLRIPAYKIWNNPSAVQRDTIKFLSS